MPAREKNWTRFNDALVKNRTAQAKALGYENFTELGYNRMIREQLPPPGGGEIPLPDQRVLGSAG